MATSNLAVQNWFETTLSGAISASDTTIGLNTLPTGTEGYLVIEPDNISSREVIYYTSKTGAAVILPSVGAGRGQDGTSAVSHAQGATVRMQVVSAYWEALQDGTAFPDDAFNPSLVLGSDEFISDHVASGLIWSGDAYASTLLASMTSGVVYINGKRITLSAVTARAFTASRDTYVDVGVDGVIDYNEVTNNAASPALSANHIRIAIIVTGATNIAAAGSVNQGQEEKVLPIASSIPYTVTDSLGNIICNRNSRPLIIGMRRITTNFSTASASAVQVTGLTVPVNIPTAWVGRKLKITLSGSEFFNTGVQLARASIWNGVVASGTQLIQTDVDSYTGTAGVPLYCEAVLTPSASGLVTFNAGLLAGANTATIAAAATSPALLKVELS